MVAVFLAAEVTSERYGPQITEILARLGQPRGIVEQPDTRDEAANAIRRQVLAAYREHFGVVLDRVPVAAHPG